MEVLRFIFKCSYGIENNNIIITCVINEYSGLDILQTSVLLYKQTKKRKINYY